VIFCKGSVAPESLGNSAVNSGGKLNMLLALVSLLSFFFLFFFNLFIFIFEDFRTLILFEKFRMSKFMFG